MPLLYFNPILPGTVIFPEGRDRLLNHMESCGIQVEVFSTAAALVERLHRSLHDITGIVLIIAGKSNLHTFKQNEALFEEIPLFVLLPANDAEMIALGRALHPCYLGTIEDNFTDLKNVLWQHLHILKQNIHHLGYDICGVTW